MALPSNVGAGSLFGNPLTPVHINTTSGDFYVVALFNGVMEVYRSTDDGDTWSRQDTSNNPAETAIITATSRLDGTTLHIATSNNQVTSADYYYHSFNTSSNVWVTTDEAIETGVDARGATSGLAVDIAVRSGGDVVAVYLGTHENVMGTRYTRIYYNIKSSGTWGTPAEVSDSGVSSHYDEPRVVIGASDKAHFIYNNNTNPVHKSLTSGGTLSSAEDLGSTVPAGFSQLFYVDESGSEVIYVVFPTSTDIVEYSITNDGTPSSVGTVTATNPNVWVAFDIDSNTSKRYVLFSDATADDFFIVEYNAGWGSDTAVTTGTMLELAGSIFENSGGDTIFAHVYEDAGTVKYNEYVIVAGGGAQTVNTTAGVLASAGVSISITPGAITVNATTATLASAGQAVTVGNISTINTATGTIASSGHTSSITPGGVTINAGVGTLTSAGSGASVTPGSISVSANAGSVVSAGQVSNVTTGNVSVSTNSATLASAGASASVTPGGVSISSIASTLSSAGLSATVSASSGGQTINATVGTITSSGASASLQVGVVTVSSTVATLTSAGQVATISGVAPAQTINASMATLSSSGHASAITPGAISITGIVGVLAIAGQGATISGVAPAQTINTTVAILASSGISATVAPVNISVDASIGILASSAIPSSIEPGSVSIVLTTGVLNSEGRSGIIGSLIGYYDPDDTYCPSIMEWQYTPAMQPLYETDIQKRSYVSKT